MQACIAIKGIKRLSLLKYIDLYTPVKRRDVLCDHLWWAGGVSFASSLRSPSLERIPTYQYFQYFDIFKGVSVVKF